MHGEARQSPAVGIEVVGLSTVNYALPQNDVPILREVTLTNRGENVLRDLALTVRAEPAFADPLSILLEELLPGEPYRLHSPRLVLSPAYLAEVRERTSGLLRLSLVERVEAGESVPGGVLGMQTHEIDLLACDEWNGLQTLPEILAAFVMPNSSAVALLQKPTDNPDES